jgi:hypothetical protein
MKLYRVSDLADRTGMSARYWQQRFQAGEVDGIKSRTCGARRLYLIPESVFDDLVNNGLEDVTTWRARSEGAEKSGGVASARPARRTGNAALKQRVKQSLANALQRGRQS